MTNAIWVWIAPPATAFLCALAAVWLVERNARSLGLVDLPNARSSHLEPRPRGGGLGILAGVAVAGAVASGAGARWPADCWVLLGGAWLVAIVGLWDDVRPLAIWPRLLVQAIAAAFVVATIGGVERLPLPPPADVALGAVGPLLTIVWIVGVTNFFNFMDGVDGLAGGQAVISFAVLAWALWPEPDAGLALVLLAATAGFLVRNWSPARIFLGDVGSAFLGFLLAGLPLAGAVQARPRLVFLIGLSLTLFLLDPLITLVVRGRRRAAFGASHRDHAYQQFVQPGRPHASAVMVLLAVGLVLALMAATAHERPALAWPAVGVAVTAFAVEWRAAARRRVRT
jgi:Fuc2NAc and GlcNAc transferase